MPIRKRLETYLMSLVCLYQSIYLSIYRSISVWYIYIYIYIYAWCVCVFIYQWYSVRIYPSYSARICIYHLVHLNTFRSIPIRSYLDASASSETVIVGENCKLFAFHIALISLENVRITLFPFQLEIKNRVDWSLYPWYGNQSCRRKTLNLNLLNST